MRYTATPAAVAFPFVPIPQKRAPTSANGPSLDARQVKFPATSIAEAAAQTDELVNECERLFKKRSLEELVRRIERMPHLLFNPRIRAIWLDVQAFKRKIRLKGRPYGQREHPLLVAALVEELMARGRAKIKDFAFSELARYGISYSTARDLWYQAWSDSRFRPLFHKHEALEREAGTDEIAALSRCPTLQPGKTASTVIKHPKLGTITVTLNAEPE